MSGLQQPRDEGELRGGIERLFGTDHNIAT